MKLAIIGSRGYTNLPAVKTYVHSLPRDVIVVSGGARGVDTYAVLEASRREMQTQVYPADWHKHGKSAGMIRNKHMLSQVDAVTAFWDGSSKGTKHAIGFARARGIPVVVYGVDGKKR